MIIPFRFQPLTLGETKKKENMTPYICSGLNKGGKEIKTELQGSNLAQRSNSLSSEEERFQESNTRG